MCQKLISFPSISEDQLVLSSDIWALKDQLVGVHLPHYASPTTLTTPATPTTPTTLTNPLSSPTNHIRTRKAPASMASINQNLLYITLPEGSLRSVKKFFFPNREKFTFYPLGSLPGYYHFSLNRNCWVDDLYPLKRTWNFIQKSWIFRREALRGEICPSCHSRRRECRLFASGVNFSMNTNFVVILSLKLFRFMV